jgi:hypothetical protein
METRICSNGTNLYTSTTCKKSRAQRQIWISMEFDKCPVNMIK